jgi:hypothetical protein
MQNIIDFRGLEALKTSSVMSTEISRLAQKNAEKSQKDARTITTITIFTMIYLPASFVSVSPEPQAPTPTIVILMADKA